MAFNVSGTIPSKRGRAIAILRGMPSNEADRKYQDNLLRIGIVIVGDESRVELAHNLHKQLEQIGTDKRGKF